MFLQFFDFYGLWIDLDLDHLELQVIDPIGVRCLIMQQYGVFANRLCK